MVEKRNFQKHAKSKNPEGRLWELNILAKQEKQSANNGSNWFGLLQRTRHRYVSAPGDTHAAVPSWGGGRRRWPSSFQGPGCASSRGDGQQAASSGSATAQVCLHHVHSQEPEQTHQPNFSHNPLTPRSSRGYMLAQLLPWRGHDVLPYGGMDSVGQWAKTCSLKRKGRKC